MPSYPSPGLRNKNIRKNLIWICFSLPGEVPISGILCFNILFQIKLQTEHIERTGKKTAADGRRIDGVRDHLEVSGRLLLHLPADSECRKRGGSILSLMTTFYITGLGHKTYLDKEGRKEEKREGGRKYKSSSSFLRVPSELFLVCIFLTFD